VRIVGSDGRVCSGTIIGSKKIVTAAHCFASTDASRYRIMVLDHRFVEHWVGVSSIRIHPKFDRSGLEHQTQLNDIAIVKAAASLPADMAVAAVGGAILGEVTAVGFGTGFYGHDLRQVELQAKNAALSPTGSQILTSIDGGACSGDSGGPIFRKSGSSFVLVGVISWTMGACGAMTAVTPVGRYRGFLGG
jgi:secreted trypsin-like serine protease